jgi:hypothetical protein
LSHAAESDMTANFRAFATLDTDLLHLVLSKVEHGIDAARAGATCKHWRAVASTERLWRELCIAEWPSTALLRRSPASYLAFYQQRSRSWSFKERCIDLNTITVLIDGTLGRRQYSAVLDFQEASADRDAIFLDRYTWELPLSTPELRDIFEYADADEVITVDFMRADGKIAVQEALFELVDREMLQEEHNEDPLANEQDYDRLLFTRALDLEHHTEAVTRQSQFFYRLYIELQASGSVRLWASTKRVQGELVMPCEVGFALSLLDWQ